MRTGTLPRERRGAYRSRPKLTFNAARFLAELADRDAERPVAPPPADPRTFGLEALIVERCGDECRVLDVHGELRWWPARLVTLPKCYACDLPASGARSRAVGPLVTAPDLLLQWACYRHEDVTLERLVELADAGVLQPPVEMARRVA